ncbi:hypothetical protein, partial [Bacillus mojavensis]|uniref:hypothetical protein n=1 Tax=Bacillus mojavensis TaxID=72360 RepID=UPI002DB6C6A2
INRQHMIAHQTPKVRLNHIGHQDLQIINRQHMIVHQTPKVRPNHIVHQDLLIFIVPEAKRKIIAMKRLLKQ